MPRYPRGAILGPLLLLIYANDIVDNIKSDPSAFAGDTALIKVDIIVTRWSLFHLLQQGTSVDFC